VTLTFDLLILKVVSESRVTWATSVPILVFLGLSVLDLGPMYTRQTDVRQHYRFMPPPIKGGGITKKKETAVIMICAADADREGAGGIERERERERERELVNR